jgi:hypothetical protein
MGVASIGEAQQASTGAAVAAKQQAALRHPGTAIAALGLEVGIPFKMHRLEHVEGARGCSEQCVDQCKIRRHAVAVAGHRPRIDPGTAHAMGEAYQGRWEDPIVATWLDGGTGDEAFDAVVAGGGLAGMDKDMPKAKALMLDYLAAAGPVGLTVGMIVKRLEAATRPGKDGSAPGLAKAPVRETVHRWLRELDADGTVQNKETMWSIRRDPTTRTGTDG